MSYWFLYIYLYIYAYIDYWYLSCSLLSELLRLCLIFHLLGMCYHALSTIKLVIAKVLIVMFIKVPFFQWFMKNVRDKVSISPLTKTFQQLLEKSIYSAIYAQRWLTLATTNRLLWLNFWHWDALAYLRVNNNLGLFVFLPCLLIRSLIRRLKQLCSLQKIVIYQRLYSRNLVGWSYGLLRPTLISC